MRLNCRLVKNPEITTTNFDSGELELGKPGGDYGWQMIIVYRGKYCSLCTMYLKKLKTGFAILILFVILKIVIRFAVRITKCYC